MKPASLLALLVEFYGDKAALYRRHVAVARVAPQYDINNTYQYIVAREEQHLEWVRQAILDLGEAVPADPAVEAPGAPRDEAGLQALARSDADALRAAIERWRPRVATVANARHRKMLELTLGEMLEQVRFFQQAADGRLDLLGRRTGGPRTGGGVVGSRWVG